MNPFEADYIPAWDTTMCSSSTAGTEVRRLMTLALKGSLTLQQQQQLMDGLERDPKLVYHIGLTPAKVCLLLYFFMCIRFSDHISYITCEINYFLYFNFFSYFCKSECLVQFTESTFQKQWVEIFVRLKSLLLIGLK